VSPPVHRPDPLRSHPPARLTPVSRERLIRRHLYAGVPLKPLAMQAGIGLRCTYKLAGPVPFRRHHGTGGRSIRRIARTPKPPVRRFQKERPGDMIPGDIKQLARFGRVDLRIAGDRRQG
jgi:hypothetical protein